MNKRGVELVMSAWLVLCLVIVGVVVVYVTVGFINKTIDTNFAHSQTIYSNIYDCLTDNGYLAQDFFGLEFDLEKYCSVKFDVMENDERGYVQVKLINESKSLVKDLRFGEKSLISTCNLGFKILGLSCYSNSQVVNYYNSTREDQQSFLLTIDVGLKGLGERK